MPKTYPIIGFSGPAGSGKDTAGSFALTYLGGYTYSFAFPVKRMLACIGVDMFDPYWRSKVDENIPMLGVSPRQLMQTLGTDWGREIVNQDLWVLMAKDRFLRSGPGMIITDVRFENEAAWIRSLGGRIIHLQSRKNDKTNKHKSEDLIEIKPEDIVIQNNSTLEDLQQKVKDVFSGQHKT